MPRYRVEFKTNSVTGYHESAADAEASARSALTTINGEDPGPVLDTFLVPDAADDDSRGKSPIQVIGFTDC